MEGGRSDSDIQEASALLEWVNSCPCISIEYDSFIQLRDGVALSMILNDIDPLEFHLQPRSGYLGRNDLCIIHLQAIIDSIVLYYYRTKGWTLESNIQVNDICLSQAIDQLILIVRWVITTILFSQKKTVYIQTILTLSPQTQYYLQLVIEAVMNTFPQDETSLSAINEMHSILEESQLIPNRLAFQDQSSLAISAENSRLELHRQFEDEIRELEHQVLSLQQSLVSQQEEAELLRRQRDELQLEVIRLESELTMQRQVMSGLEGQERRLSLEVEGSSSRFQREIHDVHEANEQLARKVELFSSENEHYLQEVEFLRRNKENEVQRHQRVITEYEEELKQLHNEIHVMTSEKEFLLKATEKTETLKQRVDILKAIEVEHIQLKKEYDSLQQRFESMQVTSDEGTGLVEETKKLREDIGTLRGRLEAMTMEREVLQIQIDRIRQENKELRSENITLKKRCVDNERDSDHPSKIGDSLSSLLVQQSPSDTNLKEKVRQYIVENSELRMRLQKQQRMYEEKIQGKEEEYVMSRKAIEEEYKNRIMEAAELKDHIDETEMNLANQAGQLIDLHDVITTQKKSIEQLKQLIDQREEDMKVKGEQYQDLEKRYEHTKRVCNEYKAKEDDDRKRRRDYLEIDRRVIQREREVMRNTLFRKGNDILKGTSTNIIKESRSAQFLKKSQSYE